jgi:hypothetical protein
LTPPRDMRRMSRDRGNSFKRQWQKMEVATAPSGETAVRRAKCPLAPRNLLGENKANH